MNPSFPLALTIITGIWLSGCELVLAPAMLLSAPAPSGAKQGYESETVIKSNDLLSIRTIAILEIPEPPNYGRDIGFATENAEYEGLSFGNTAQTYLNQYLNKYGFDVIECSPIRVEEHRLMVDYAYLDIKGADAYLDVVPIEVEYKFRFGKNGPHVSTSFRLVSAVSNEEIYTGSIQYGWKDLGVRSAGVKIESPEDHKYESSEALLANKKEATEWLVQGIEAVSLSIGKSIVEGKFEGMAAKELDTKSYDENLWAKALKEAEGNEKKQKIKYIELRTGQLYSENVSSVSAPTICEKSITISERLSLQQAGVYDFSGIYSSTLTGINAQSILGINPVVKLTQKGKKVSGTFGTTGGHFWGEIEDGSIKFEYRTSGGGSGSGKWTVEPNSGELFGKWDSTTWQGSGKWNLKRIE